MAKLLITGDLQFRSSNPLARKDSFIEAITAKLYEIAELARQYVVDAVIIPGDVFDSASVAIPTIVHLAKILKNFPCPVLTVPGNHDEFGHNLNSIPRTPYGLLERLEYIHNLHNNCYFIATNLDFMITGHGFNTETDYDLSQYAMSKEIIDDANAVCRTYQAKGREYSPFYIHVAHGMLLDEAPGTQERFTFVSQLAEIPEELQPHILVCGHYHFGLDLQKVGKTLVINPGAISRVTAHVNEISRPIQVALLTVNSPEDYHAEFIPLKSALPGDQVLSREHIEAKIETDKRMDEFLSLLASEGESKFLEVRDIVEDIAARENIPESVKREALERIGRARERMAKSEVTG